MVDYSAPSPPMATADSALRVRLRRSGELIRSLLKNPTTVVGLVIITLLISMAVFAPLLSEPNTPDPYQMPRDWGAIAEPPGSPDHPFASSLTGASSRALAEGYSAETGRPWTQPIV